MTVVTGPPPNAVTRQQILDEGIEINSSLLSLQTIDPPWIHTILISGLNVPACYENSEAAAWRQVANGLELTAEQQAALERLREENMAPMGSLYQARRMLLHQMGTLSDGWRTLVASIASPASVDLQTGDKLKFVQRLEAVGQVRERERESVRSPQRLFPLTSGALGVFSSVGALIRTDQTVYERRQRVHATCVDSFLRPS
jgi:hypothetical protein